MLGIATILAIVAFINHSAHATDVSEILERVRHEAVAQVQREWTPTDLGARPADDAHNAADPPEGTSSWVIRFDRTGWVQEFDADALLACVPSGGVPRLVT